MVLPVSTSYWRIWIMNKNLGGEAPGPGSFTGDYPYANTNGRIWRYTSDYHHHGATISGMLSSFLLWLEIGLV